MTSTGQMEDIGAHIEKLTEAVDGIDDTSGVQEKCNNIALALENALPMLALIALTPYAGANAKAQKVCETLMIYVGSQAEEQEWFKRIQKVKKRASDIVDLAMSESNAKVEKSAVTT